MESTCQVLTQGELHSWRHLRALSIPDLTNKGPKSNPTNWNKYDEILIRKSGRSWLGRGKTGLA